MQKFILLSLCCMTVLPYGSSAQNAKPVDLGRATELGQLPEWRRRNLVWTTATWSGDDRPYAATRQAIDKAVANDKNPKTLLEGYEKSYSQAPEDSKAAFRWAYAAWLARKQVSGRSEQFQIIFGPQKALLHVKFPCTYQFARLLFLYQSWEPSLPQLLVGTGHKLLQRNPQDYDVKYYLTWLMSKSSDPKERSQALTFVQGFIKKQPQKASYHSLLGGIYFRQWRDTKSRSDADNATAAYRKYLQLAPANDDFRSQAERLINLMQKK